MLRPHRFPASARRRARVLAFAAAVVLLTVPSGAQTIEREMFVSVLDQAGKPVLTLGVPDFIVREDGRAREVLRARRATDVIDIALLVDNSQALLSQALWALGLYIFSRYSFDRIRRGLSIQGG